MLDDELSTYKLRLLLEKRLALNYLLRAKAKRQESFSNEALEAISRFQNSVNAIPDDHLQQWHQKRLIAVQNALNRFASGSYSKCIRCSQNISQARLNADPSVTYCYHCRVITEKEEFTNLAFDT